MPTYSIDVEIHTLYAIDVVADDEDEALEYASNCDLRRKGTQVYQEVYEAIVTEVRVGA
jgi:hypothetical protein